jgi:hypothetical protein
MQDQFDLTTYVSESTQASGVPLMVTDDAIFSAVLLMILVRL